MPYRPKIRENPETTGTAGRRRLRCFSVWMIQNCHCIRCFASARQKGACWFKRHVSCPAFAKATRASLPCQGYDGRSAFAQARADMSAEALANAKVDREGLRRPRREPPPPGAVRA